MVTSTKPPRNGFVRAARKVYNPIGFGKGYNFVFWLIFGGALLGFSLSRFPMLDFYGKFCSKEGEGSPFHAGPGECWYYLRGNHETVGIIMHLAGVIPGSFLAFFQFVPVIRHKLILFHRVNGYVVILLSLVGTVGALMIVRHAFGGGLATQVSLGLLGIMFTGALLLAYINVKLLQIEQHRAWMLRAWAYGGCILSIRIIMTVMALIISDLDGYYAPQPCGQIDSMLRGNRTEVLAVFPQCQSFYSGENPGQWAIAQANLKTDNDAFSAAALGTSCGAAAWLALAIHAIGVELYLRLTPAEHERLRRVSYQRQLEAGMKDPGRGGITVDRFGDAEKWSPPITEVGHGEASPDKALQGSRIESSD